MMLQIELNVIGASELGSAGRLSITQLSDHTFRGTLRIVEDGTETVGNDLFAMLADLRLSLDARGMRPLCNGARRDVRPSTMARQMSLGRKAYVYTLGRRPSLEDLCDIFAPADADQVVSVAEQRRNWEWKRSVGIE